MADSSNTQDLAKLPQQSQALVLGTTSGQCDRATVQQGKSELGGCLTLVSPSGLTADDRKEWIAVAMQTLSGIPADLLAEGCAEARRRCRFPSEIVPTIMEAIGKRWEWRKDAARRPAPLPTTHQIAAPVDDEPITLTELIAMPRHMVEIARKQGWVEADVLAEFDRRAA